MLLGEADHAEAALAGRYGDDRYCTMNPALVRQVERLRAMTADEKVRLSHALCLEARDLLAAGVRARHPDWSDTQVATQVRELVRDTGA
jgi:hypothetical protein